MSDALGKLIRLSSRHNMPVIVHDSQSGESAVLLSLDEYENLAQCREECYDEEAMEEELLKEYLEEQAELQSDGSDWSRAVEEDRDEENGDLDETPDKEKYPAFQVEEDAHFDTENSKVPTGKKVKFSGTFEGKNNFPFAAEAEASFPPEPAVEESTSPWSDPNFAAFYDKQVKMAHDLHRDKQDIDWAAKDQTGEFRYEPTRENGMFPAFNPNENDDEGDEEPIFFEEPV